MKKLTVFLYGAVCYSIFLFTFLYAIGFTGNVFVPTTVDDAISGDGIGDILINVVLLSIFALQHSIMARPAFKKWWVKIIPEPIERSTYVLLASLALLLMFANWRSFNGIIWQASSPVAQYILTAVFFAGWLIVLLSTFMINHFDLFGLKQVFYYFKNKPTEELAFRTNWFYKIVRHPIMLGFLIAFWGTPVMTAGHLLFSIVTTAYILVAIYFLEERDLVKSIGKPYTDYKKDVPMLIPFTKGKKAALVSEEFAEIKSI